jgi:DNA polymerase-3 subunit delta
MPLKQLLNSLESGPMPVYLLRGDAHPIRERALKVLVEQVSKNVAMPALNRAVYRGNEENGGQAVQAAQTLPMMADRRVVVLRDLESAPVAMLEKVLGYVSNPSDTTVFIMSTGGFPKVVKGGKNFGTRIVNAVKKTGKIFAYRSEDVSPVEFAVMAAQKGGKHIGRREASLLIELVGGDLGLLDQEIAKVCLYVGDAPTIESKDIHDATALLAEPVIWDLTTGLASRDSDQTLRALHRLQEAGDDPRKLLGLVGWQMRELIKMSELVHLGKSEREIRKEVKMRWDLFQRVLPILRRRGFDAHQVLPRLAMANQQMNSHRAGASHVFERLVFDLLSPS